MKKKCKLSSICTVTLTVFSTFFFNVIASPPKKDIGNLAGKKRFTFTEEDDARLKELVKNGKNTPWTDIAKKMGPDFTPRRCRDRYLFYLRPDLTINKAFTKEEDIKLLQLVDKLGNRWTTIAKYLEGRSEVAIKNRYRALSKTNLVDPTGKKYAGTEKIKEKSEEKSEENINKVIDGCDSDWPFGSIDDFFW